MNEIKEILQGVAGDGISDDRLAEIARTWAELGSLLKSAQSHDGVTGAAVRQAQAYLAEVEAT